MTPIPDNDQDAGAATLLLLMPVFSQPLFAFVSGHFVFLSFLTAWHVLFGYLF
jgi:hypothetical protein